MYVPTLHSERLRLEPLCAADAARMFPVLQDESIYRYTPGAPPESVAALAARYAKLERGVSPSGTQLWLNWIIVLTDGDIPLGYVQATVEGDLAWVAYVLALHARGRGFATEATALMLDHLASRGVREARASIDPRNEASRRLVERLGFQPLVHEVVNDGVEPDDVVYVKHINTPE